ncbi:sialin-like isoform X2 [Amblyomma americanum]
MVNQTASAYEQGPLFATTPSLSRSRGNDTVQAPEAVNATYTTPTPQLGGAAGDGQCPVLVQHRDAPKHAGEGEFPWSPWTQGVVLGAFFYGYAATQLPGGWLAAHAGGKWPFGLGLLGTALGSLATPAAARASSESSGAGALVAVRVLEGLGEGVTYPAMFGMVAQWAPPHERGSLLAVAYVGANVGAILAMPLTAVLCDSIGWEAAFYVFGMVGCIYFVLYSWRVRSTPEQDPWIGEAEWDYISRGRVAKPLPPLQAKAVEAGGVDMLESSTPWLPLLTSVPLWALTASRFACLWGQFTVLTGLPTYLAAVLRMPLAKSGLVNAAMFGAQSAGMLAGGLFSDRLRRQGRLSTTTIRKLFQTAALTGAGLLLALVPSAGCNQALVSMLLVLAMGVYGLAAGGATPALVDMAPAHAGILYGIAGTVSNASGFLAPLIVGMLTSPAPSLGNWATVFYLTCGIYLLGALAFLAFGSAEVQPWAQPAPQHGTVASHIEHQADNAHRFDLTTSFAESFHMF